MIERSYVEGKAKDKEDRGEGIVGVGWHGAACVLAGKSPLRRADGRSALLSSPLPLLLYSLLLPGTRLSLFWSTRGGFLPLGLRDVVSFHCPGL